jgi:nicotinamide riboside kinase
MTLAYVITGPESTGKSILTQQLAHAFNAIAEPEFARTYIESLNRKYQYSDVETIARQQIKQQRHHILQNTQLVSFDTGLIITKVWFEVVFNKCPHWLIEALNTIPIAGYLLCEPDLPWVPDNVRENGGHMRINLFNQYKAEIVRLNVPYAIINGVGNARLQNAQNALKCMGIEQNISN